MTINCTAAVDGVAPSWLPVPHELGILALRSELQGCEAGYLVHLHLPVPRMVVRMN